jgi:DNA-binding MarR family transcriptional regulator
LELTARQAAAILALVENPGMALNNLADAVGADQATASALVERLLTANLVSRQTDSEDRRRVVLQPTDKALRLGQALASARMASEERIRAVLGDADSNQLADLLTRVVDGLENRTRPGVLNGGRRS